MLKSSFFRQSLPIFYYYLRHKYRMRFSTRHALETFQLQALNQHLAWLVTVSPFYRERLANLTLPLTSLTQLSQLPTIDKSVMMAHFDTLNTAGLTRSACEALALQAEQSRDFTPCLGDYIIGLSSGTSGHRGLFVVSPSEKNQWAGGILAKALPNGLLRPHAPHRIAFFLRANSNLYESVQNRSITFEFFDLLEPLENHLARLHHLQPTLLVGPASLLVLIAQAIQAGDLSLSPERIYAVAEILESDQAAFLSDVFHQPIHQIYQATEGFLGITCEAGHLHLNEELCVIEKEYIDDTRFYPIITDFTRTTQPLVRYRLNDLLVEDPTPCPCGSPFIRLAAIEGRADDIFHFYDAQQRLISVFPDFIRRALLLSSPHILNYQVSQCSPTLIQCYLELSPDASREDVEQHVRAQFYDLFERVQVAAPQRITLEFVSSGLVERGAKARRVKRCF